MIIRRIRLSNFTSFYGEHVLQLEKGITFIQGHCGSGRTNLARAFRFAVLGEADTPRNRLIHFKHVQECKEKSENPFCEVEVEVWHKDRTYVSWGRLFLAGREKRQTTVVDTDIDDIITPENFKLIYLDPWLETEEDDKDETHGVRLVNTITKHLETNMKVGIKMAILDRVIEHLTIEREEQLLTLIESMPLEQVIILGARLPYYSSNHQFRVCTIKYDIEKCSSVFAQ